MANPRGRSATVEFHPQKGLGVEYQLDPAYALTGDCIHYMACAFWDGWLPRRVLLRAWSSAFDVVAEGCSWRRAVDPFLAFALSCRRLGWVSVKPGTVRTDLGRRVDLDNLCPKTVQALARHSTRRWLLRRMVARDPDLRGIGADAIPWIFPLQRLFNSKFYGDWDPAQSGTLRAGVAGAICSCEWLYRTGQQDDHTCRCCGTEHAGVHHRLYCCPAQEAWRLQYALPQKLLSDALLPADNPFWTRCVMADPTASLPVLNPMLAPVWTVPPADGSYRFSATCYGDGSSRALFGPESARAGYGVIQLRLFVLEVVFIWPHACVGPCHTLSNLPRSRTLRPCLVCAFCLGYSGAGVLH